MALSLRFLFIFGALALSLCIGEKSIVTGRPNINFDGTVMVPGLGRFMIPGKGVDPLHANPITGGPDGIQVPKYGFDGLFGVRRRYTPGGDDTLIPNFGFGVPMPHSSQGGDDDGTTSYHNPEAEGVDFHLTSLP